tara:strand:+ start:2751 stop:3770 length:1020 start_codon:yes stop_codon:yes gene_type:complete
MKKYLILAGLLLVIPVMNAQKQEIRKAERAVKSGYLSDAFSYLENAKRIFAAADSETRAFYYVVEAEMKLANKEMDMEQMESVSNSLKHANNYDLSSSLKIRVADINSKLLTLSARAAPNEFNKKNFSEAAILYNVAYLSTQDTVQFYMAAKSHLLAKEYEEAFNAYKRLIMMGYTNAKIKYVATNIKTGKKEVFTTLNMRNTAIELGTHIKPEIIQSRSKKTELLRALTSTSIQLNRSYEAVVIIDRELAKAPDDKILLNQAFHLYNQLGDKDKLHKIMDLLIKESPNDPNLYYNLGVSCAQSNDMDKAIEFYKKTLDLDPGYANANINLSIIMKDRE